jgi:hypothetical protein
MKIRLTKFLIPNNPAINLGNAQCDESATTTIIHSPVLIIRPTKGLLYQPAQFSPTLKWPVTLPFSQIVLPSIYIVCSRLCPSSGIECVFACFCHTPTLSLQQKSIIKMHSDSHHIIEQQLLYSMLKTSNNNNNFCFRFAFNSVCNLQV